MKEFTSFEQAIGTIFNDKQLLTTAFTHRSYLNENPGTGLEHNERLEFLGDAVLELIVTNYLYRKYPQEPEGRLTSYRAALVNAVIIAEIATGLGMNDYLLLSKGEAKDNGKARQYILANTYEAILGAIYLDLGYDAGKVFVEQTLLPRLDEIVAKKLWRDPKSLVQEMAQEHVGMTPAYKVISESGPDHDKYFTIGIYFGEELVAKGKGKSKQEGEQSAAQEALEKRNWL
ncbi:MAG: ribonuclease III [Candidatus Pacebacteria bacterium]|nr:ribonuclease III [Candidatus Paceibacterota bacterium]